MVNDMSLELANLFTPHRLKSKALRKLWLAQRKEALRGFACEKGLIEEPAPR
jgi:hypothetical protein